MAEKKTLQIGVSRPPMELMDLPSPEEAFKIPNTSLSNTLRFIVGPSLIALGVSIGSGEWLIGPRNIATYGFRGVGFIILISAILQVLYNVEVARFTVATGEPPIVAFGRTPPGFWFWTPFAVLCFYIAFIWGGWVASAGQTLFPILFGKAPNMALGTPDRNLVAWLGTGLLGLVFLITFFAKKISRVMEIWNGVMVAFILLSLVIFDLVLVPINYWWEAISSLFIPAIPKGADATLLGALAGFTATAAGLNYFILGYYRDKGYGMGARMGFLAGARTRQEAILHAGVTFPDDAKNEKTWKRWFRFLCIDQWGVFFIGALLGMVLPGMLVNYLAKQPGAAAPTAANMPVWVAGELQRNTGDLFFYWALLIGFLILFSTQMTVFETLVRNFVDAAYGVSARVRKIVQGDPRKLYYPLMLVLLIAISIFIRVALPQDLVQTSANFSNFASLFFPLVMVYLNLKLPKVARMRWWGILAMVLNFLFFGFFFVNFVSSYFFKAQLVKF
jgi:hypothetical protein